MKKSSLFCLFFCLLASHAVHAEDHANDGAMIYKAKCGTCHAVDQNRVGPKSNGVFGRKAGSVPDYVYSPALASSGLVWDEATLDKWLSGPSALVAGTKMSFKLNNAQDRTDVIAYLKTLAAK